MTQLSFFVAGTPQTQAGMQSVPTPAGFRQITTGSADLKPWRRKVTEVAQLAMRSQHWVSLDEGPVTVVLRFLLPMPQSRKAAVRHAGIDYNCTSSDLDKLTRAIGDSMTLAGVYKDDRQIARSTQAKYEVYDHRLVGVEVVVEPCDVDTEALARLLDRRRAALRPTGGTAPGRSSAGRRTPGPARR